MVLTARLAIKLFEAAFAVTPLKRRGHTLSTYPLLRVCTGLTEDRSVMDV